MPPLNAQYDPRPAVLAAGQTETRINKQTPNASQQEWLRSDVDEHDAPDRE